MKIFEYIFSFIVLVKVLNPLLKFETSLVEWEPARLSPQISQLPVSFLASLTRCMASFFFPSSVRNGIQVNGPSLPGQSPKQWFARIPRAIAYPFFLYHVFDGQDDDKTGTRKGNYIIHKVKFLCHSCRTVNQVCQVFYKDIDSDPFPSILPITTSQRWITPRTVGVHITVRTIVIDIPSWNLNTCFQQYRR